MNLINKITNFYLSNRKNIFYILLFFIFFILFIDNSFATTDTSNAKNPNTNEQSALVSFLNEFLKWVAIILTLWTNLVWWFLSPDWTTWKLVWIDWILKSIWIMVSNIVYFIFAFIFVWIALMNILWKWDWYEVKTAIPRFIVWVLIVPFSWFFVQITLSVSNVLTARVLSLPMSEEIASLPWYKDTISQTRNFCTSWWQITTWDPKYINDLQTDWWVKWSNYIISCNNKDSNNNVNLKDLFVGEWIYSVMYYYTFSVMSLENYSRIFQWDVLAWVTDIVWVVFKLWFSWIFILVYRLLLIALILIMATRIIYLWMFTMFSPLFWLTYFLKKEWSWDGIMSKFTIKEYLSLAFLPVFVSRALAFWMIFLITAWSKVVDNKLVSWQCIQMPFTSDKMKTEICWHWVYHDEKSKTHQGDASSWNFWNLLLQLFALMFLWIALMAAIKTSKIVAEVASPIENIWKSVWDIMRKAPQNLPIIPTKWEDWKTQMMTMKWFEQSIWNIKSWLEQASATSWKWFQNSIEKFLPTLNKELMKLRETYQDISRKSWQEKNKALYATLDDWYMNKALTDSATRKRVIDGMKLSWVELTDADFNNINNLSAKLSKVFSDAKFSEWITSDERTQKNIMDKIEKWSTSSIPAIKTADEIMKSKWIIKWTNDKELKFKDNNNQDITIKINSNMTWEDYKKLIDRWLKEDEIKKILTDKWWLKDSDIDAIVKKYNNLNKPSNT